MLNNKQIQTNLKYLGFYKGKIDGKIGLSTKSAIKSFQKSFELTRDGIWGKNSNAKCIAVVKDIQKKIGCKAVDGIVRSRDNRQNDNLPEISWLTSRWYCRSTNKSQT